MIWTLVAVELPSVHVPVSAIVTTWPEPLSVPVQLAPNVAALSETVGEAGTVKPLGKVTASESPALSVPLALVVKLTVQFAVEPAVCVVLLKPTLVTAVATAIVGETVAVVAMSTLV